MLLIKDLQQRFVKNGIIVYIAVRPARLEPVLALQMVDATEGTGLLGDRYRTKNGSRQVTLIQREHLQSMGSFLGREINPEMVRRNLVVQGINLLSLKGLQFQVGEAIFEYSGECHPCSRMEQNLGPGGYNAMRGLGGITAKVIRTGRISIGDELRAL
jgi:MOSC domain-containing protein YiiM